jgi:xylulokinase
LKRYILAHDLGTTGDKATLFDDSGALHSSAFAPYETTYPHSGWAEQDPNDWWDALCQSTRHLVTHTSVTAEDIACVVFSGQMMGLVAVNRQGLPLRRALIWADQRAESVVERVAQRTGPQRIYEVTGHRLSSSYSAAKMRWFEESEPVIAAQAVSYLQAKDAMVARLTGVFATDPSDASGTNLYDIRRGAWSDELVEAFGVAQEKLPAIYPSTTVVGDIRPDAASQIGLRAGTPVVLGGGDGSCAATGAGVVSIGSAYCYVGSSSWIMAATAEPLLDPSMRTVTWAHVVPGLFVPAGTMQAAGASYQWARDELARDLVGLSAAQGVSPYDLMNEAVLHSPPGARGVVFLPYLLGERSPRWNPQARAAFVGLTVRHGRDDLLRAVLEGVAFNLRVILEVLAGQGAPVASLRIMGGGAQSVAWCQVLADILAVPLHRLTVLEEGTSMGAAVVGGIGIGLWKDFSQALALARVQDVVAPNPQYHDLYDRLYRIFNSIYGALDAARVYADFSALEGVLDA